MFGVGYVCAEDGVPTLEKRGVVSNVFGVVVIVFVTLQVEWNQSKHTPTKIIPTMLI